MPLTPEVPSVVRYLVPGAVAGIAAFAFSRVMIAPLIDAAIDYEGAREHAEAQLVGGEHGHSHELFTRAVQQNFGAAVGIVVFGIAMGVLFAVAYSAIRAWLDRRGFRPDSTGLALLLAAGMFVAIALMPGLKYPANPPSVGLEDTMAARSSAFLTIVVISVLSAGAALAAGLALSRRWGPWRAAGLAVGGYVVVMLAAMMLLPTFHEVPGPLAGQDGLVLDGFPAEVLAEFRLYSLMNQALMWLVIGATWACLAAVWASKRRRDVRAGAGASREPAPARFG
ncbi:CbtA family protein [Mycolicibacterium stellerae]|uniref:CbtA family protein n=1 Tax=Mycolicibacterium stellerae TaxID=2358193 RepID=UPI000F0B7C8B|nr:CbtA family protein [Mycolicibacterium stellerae]